MSLDTFLNVCHFPHFCLTNNYVTIICDLQFTQTEALALGQGARSKKRGVTATVRCPQISTPQESGWWWQQRRHSDRVLMTLRKCGFVMGESTWLGRRSQVGGGPAPHGRVHGQGQGGPQPPLRHTHRAHLQAEGEVHEVRGLLCSGTVRSFQK